MRKVKTKLSLGLEGRLQNGQLADMSVPLIASETRTFDRKAQDDFAFFSLDRNPIHLDAIQARRTQAGQPVVHGMHAVLWALDVIARNQALPRLRSSGSNFRN